MTSSNHAILSRNSIAKAILAGEQGRKDRIEQAAHERETERLGRISAAPSRAADILSGLTTAIANVVAAADETPRSFVVMWVEPHEYDGDVETRLGFRGPHTGTPERLKLAARQVYDALADLEPELVFRSKDGPMLGNGQLAIVIRLN
jgi:hypothetical protein